MTLALIPFLVCIAGLALFALLEGKGSALGKDMFWCGLLVTLAATVHKGVLVLQMGGG